MSTTTNAHGAVAAGPVRSGQRTASDVVADSVSLVALLALGGFALAVSFSHTMTFVREHGQRQGWVVVGTAVTVVLLTVQAGLETYRDSRAGRGRGWPAALLALAVVAELYANASTASASWSARLVAAWPVLVAAAALALWTRRLQHAAEAADKAGNTVAAALWEIPAQDRPAAAAEPRAALNTPEQAPVQVNTNPDEVSPEEPEGVRLSNGAAREAIEYGWRNGLSVRETAATATRSTTRVTQVWEKLEEEYGPRPSPAQLALVGVAQ